MQIFVWKSLYQNAFFLQIDQKESYNEQKNICSQISIFVNNFVIFGSTIKSYWKFHLQSKLFLSSFCVKIIL